MAPVTPPKISLPAREPAALIGAAAVAVAAIITALGHIVPISDQLKDDLVAAFVAVAVVVVVAVPMIRAQVTPNAKVAEWVDGSVVKAGPANDLESEGSEIRSVGEPPAGPGPGAAGGQ